MNPKPGSTEQPKFNNLSGERNNTLERSVVVGKGQEEKPAGVEEAFTSTVTHVASVANSTDVQRAVSTEPAAPTDNTLADAIDTIVNGAFLIRDKLNSQFSAIWDRLITAMTDGGNTKSPSPTTA